MDSLTWRKSTYSGYNGNCVEVAWRKSSYSFDHGTCVEVGNGILVRDSQDPSGPVLPVTPDGWTAFLARIRAGTSG